MIIDDRLFRIALCCGSAALVLLLAAPTSMANAKDYVLAGPGPNSTGKHWIALPFHTHTPAISLAQDLCDVIDPDLMANPLVVGRYDKGTGTLISFGCGVDACPGADCFTVDPTEAYYVELIAPAAFSILGCDSATTHEIELLDPTTSATGDNFVALPFTAALNLMTAEDMINEINSSGGVVASASRYNPDPMVDGFEAYSLFSGGTNFTIEAGRGYAVVMQVGVVYSTDYTPSVPRPSIYVVTGTSNTTTYPWAVKTRLGATVCSEQNGTLTPPDRAGAIADHFVADINGAMCAASALRLPGASFRVDLPCCGPPLLLVGLAPGPANCNVNVMACSFNPTVSKIPSSFPGSVANLTITKTGLLDDIELSWEGGCSPVAEDYGIYEGTLGDFETHTLIDCSDDGGDLTETVVPSAGDRYYLVVPIKSGVEGSYGTARITSTVVSFDRERPTGEFVCAPLQDTTKEAGCI